MVTNVPHNWTKAHTFEGTSWPWALCWSSKPQPRHWKQPPAPRYSLTFFNNKFVIEPFPPPIWQESNHEPEFTHVCKHTPPNAIQHSWSTLFWDTFERHFCLTLLRCTHLQQGSCAILCPHISLPPRSLSLSLSLSLFVGGMTRPRVVSQRRPHMWDTLVALLLDTLV